MMISELVTFLEDAVKNADELKEIKKVLNNDGKMTILEQITHLQDNTQVTNITILKQRLSKLEGMIDDAQCEFSSQADEVNSAISYFEDVHSENDYLYDATNLLDEIKSDMLDKDSDLMTTAKKTAGKKTGEITDTPFSDDDKNSLLDVISDGNSQQ